VHISHFQDVNQQTHLRLLGFSDLDEEVTEGKKIRDFLGVIKTPLLLNAGNAKVIAMPILFVTVEIIMSYMVHFVKSQFIMQCQVAGAGHEGVRGWGHGGEGGLGYGYRGHAYMPEALAEANLKLMYKTLTMMTGDTFPLKNKSKLFI
jgi:hypothetical protein